MGRECASVVWRVLVSLGSITCLLATVGCSLTDAGSRLRRLSVCLLAVCLTLPALLACGKAFAQRYSTPALGQHSRPSASIPSLSPDIPAAGGEVTQCGTLLHNERELTRLLKKKIEFLEQKLPESERDAYFTSKIGKTTHSISLPDNRHNTSLPNNFATTPATDLVYRQTDPCMELENEQDLTTLLRKKIDILEKQLAKVEKK